MEMVAGPFLCKLHASCWLRCLTRPARRTFGSLEAATQDWGCQKFWKAWWDKRGNIWTGTCVSVCNFLQIVCPEEEVSFQETGSLTPEPALVLVHLFGGR